MDGGVAETVPVPLARQLGARAVTAVNLIERNSCHRAPEYHPGDPAQRGVMTQQVAQYSLEGADLVIHPPAMQVELGDFSHAPELMEGGRRAALEALPALAGPGATNKSEKDLEAASL